MILFINYSIKEDGLKLVLDANIQSFSLVSIGAILGSNLRFKIYNILDIIKLKNDLRILLINILASFFLGFFYSISFDTSHLSYSYQLGLFFSIGFLGSLSTFSTFIYDLFELASKFKFSRAFLLFFFSLSLGLISLVIGCLLGD